MTMNVSFEWEVYRYTEEKVSRLDKDVMIQGASILIDQNWEANLIRRQNISKQVQWEELAEKIPIYEKEGWDKMLEESISCMTVDDEKLEEELKKIRREIMLKQCAIKETYAELIQGKTMLEKMRSNWGITSVQIGGRQWGEERYIGKFESLFPMHVPVGDKIPDLMGNEDTEAEVDNIQVTQSTEIPESQHLKYPPIEESCIINDEELDDWLNSLMKDI